MESSLELPSLQKGKHRKTERTRKEHRPRGPAHQHTGNAGTIKGYDSWYPDYRSIHTESGVGSRVRKGYLKRELRDDGHDWKDLLSLHNSYDEYRQSGPGSHLPEGDVSCSSHSTCSGDSQLGNPAAQAPPSSVLDAEEAEDEFVLVEEYVLVESCTESAGTAQSLDEEHQDWEWC